MYRPFQTVTHPDQQAAMLRDRRYGVIEMLDGHLAGIHLRPWPKIVSLPEVWWLGGWDHWRLQADRCWVYYNQPLSCSNFLALRYIVSGRQGSLASLHGALEVLDEIARIKRTDAIVCDVSNTRISDRLLRRWGWERHVLHSRRRHHIKRFYGTYPEPAGAWRAPLAKGAGTRGGGCGGRRSADPTKLLPELCPELYRNRARFTK